MSRKKKNNSAFVDAVKVHGFFRLQIVEDINGKPTVVGDSGWNKNTVTNDGFDQYICRSVGGMSGSKTVSHMALGTGTAPDATATTLNGEITDASNSRKAVTASTVASKTLQFTAAFNSADSFITAAKTIQNVGLFQQSNTNTATILAGQTYTTSALATNQSVNATYQLRFS